MVGKLEIKIPIKPIEPGPPLVAVSSQKNPELTNEDEMAGIAVADTGEPATWAYKLNVWDCPAAIM